MKSLKLELGTNKKEPLNPIDIFRLLPRKKQEYSYLRDVQSDVLNQWYNLHSEKEIVIKMNTGSGKTLVSLLILKSYLNQKKGPAVYVVPDNFLLSQVIEEANKIGIMMTVEPNVSFLKQESIMIINIHKLFNSRSIFGVNKRSDLNPEVFLVDDAHACIDKLEEQFRIVISKENQNCKYEQLVQLFSHTLESQGEAIYFDIIQGKPDELLQVPFWTIQENSTKIYEIISKDINSDDENYWKLDLVKNYFSLSDCIVSGTEIEFSLPSIPTEIIPTYHNARKIVVSATLPDDSVLHSGLGISKEAIDRTIRPKTEGDLGERLIVIPEEFFPNFDKNDFKQIINKSAEKVKVVIIVPSHFASNYWEDIADFIISAANIQNALAEFREMENGIAVLVNKYDGIDLPYDDCRILIIDELPNDRSLKEKLFSTVLENNKNVEIRRIRKIEQGMGRATRSPEDYSVVFLIGSKLVRTLYVRDGESAFTAATRKQVAYSRAVLQPFENSNIEEIQSAINEVLFTRSDAWVTGARSALLENDDKPEFRNSLNLAISTAMKHARNGDLANAERELENAKNAAGDPSIKGFLGYYLALMMNINNPTKAQEILKSSRKANPRIVRPIEGVTYEKLISGSGQAANCRDYYLQFADKQNAIFLHLDSVLQDLVFMPDSSATFEAAIAEVGKLIGLITQRPEMEIGKGPDNLWVGAKQEYFVIECKNGCSSSSQLISKADANQMNGSVLWFVDKYPTITKIFPILIHPFTTVSYEATLCDNVRIMSRKDLRNFKDAVKKLLLSSITNGTIADVATVHNNILFNKLDPENLFLRYTTPFQKKKTP